MKVDKAKYLFKRIVNINIKEMFKKIKIIHQKTNKNSVFIF